MAAAFLTHLAGDKVEVRSAGSAPGSSVGAAPSWARWAPTASGSGASPPAPCGLWSAAPCSPAARRPRPGRGDPGGRRPGATADPPGPGGPCPCSGGAGGAPGSGG